MMAKAPLPPGFRFHPTDVELVWYYLKRKIMGKPFRFEAISDVELYKFAPWDLPAKCCLRSRDLEWYFFCPRDRKYANGSRTNRVTETGYWKTTGKDRRIDHNSQTVGMKKTLIFHIGKAPKGTRTDWVMHEYRLQTVKLVNAGFPLEAFVLCKIFQKSGPGPKNGEQYGAPFNEEDWDDFSDNEHADPIPCYHCQEPLHDQSFLLDRVQRHPFTFEVGEPSSMLDLSEARELNSMLVQPAVSDVVEPSMEITEVVEPQSVPVQSVVSDVVEPSIEITEVEEPQLVPGHPYADGLLLEELPEFMKPSPPYQGIADGEILMSVVEDVNGVVGKDVETVYTQLDELSGPGIGLDVNGVVDKDIETVYAQLDELSGPGIGLDDLSGQSGIGLDDFPFPGIMARDNALHPLSEFSDEHYMELNDINIQTQYPFANNLSFLSAEDPFELANPNAIGYSLDNSSSFLSANYDFELADFDSTHYPFANNSSSEDLSSILPTV